MDYFFIFFLFFSLTAQTILIQVEKGSQNELTTDGLASKIEQLLALSGNPKAEEAKIELTKQIKYNFIKKLAVQILIDRPQGESEEIVKLLRQTLNGEFDFNSVLPKIPFLLRGTNEEQRLQIILSSIQEKENKEESGIQAELRQQQNSTEKPPSQFDKIVDAASKIKIEDLSKFLKEIPEIFEGIQTIVDSVDDIFGEK